MKKLIALFLITGVVLMVASRAYAADDTLGATITGSEIHTMSISGGTSLSYQDPGAEGPVTYTLTGGTTTLTLNDNNMGPFASDTMLVFASVTSSKPDWYGNGWGGSGDDDIYYFRAENVSWTPAADNTMTTFTVQDGALAGLFGGAVLGGIYATSAQNLVLSGDIDLDLKLVVLENKRVFGNESQNYTITFTFYEY